MSYELSAVIGPENLIATLGRPYVELPHGMALVPHDGDFESFLRTMFPDGGVVGIDIATWGGSDDRRAGVMYVPSVKSYMRTRDTDSVLRSLGIVTKGDMHDGGEDAFDALGLGRFDGTYEWEDAYTKPAALVRSRNRARVFEAEMRAALEDYEYSSRDVSMDDVVARIEAAVAAYRAI